MWYKLCIVSLFIILLQNGKCIKAEFYSSVQEMYKVFIYEAQMMRHMQKFIEDNETKLNILRARLHEFELARAQTLEAGPAYLESSVNRYLHMNRLTLDWQHIENLMLHNTGETALKRIQILSKKNRMPDESDLSGAIDGLLRLQYIYRLKTKHLATGLIDGVQHDTQLTARHCFDIGIFAAQDKRYLLAHSWLQEALWRLREGAEKHQVAFVVQLKANILSALVKTKMALGDFGGANKTYQQLIEIQSANENHIKLYKAFRLEYQAEIWNTHNVTEEHEPVPEDFSNLSDFELYRYTCNGYIMQNATDERLLRCGYLTETHAFLLLAPLKVEELNHDPLLVLYHDVISDAEIAVVRQLTNKTIRRATVLSETGSIVSNVRTSQFTFLPKTVHKVLEAIDVRVADMTNLNMNYAEDHQVANYGIGGHYSQHMDWFTQGVFNTNQVSSPEMGNRIATVLFYLTDVEQGGGTAFPYMKRLLLPKRGTAAFWYNLHASGDGDLRTLHGACPIIVGSKWVLNRWIREHDQADKRPCELWNDKYF